MKPRDPVSVEGETPESPATFLVTAYCPDRRCWLDGITSSGSYAEIGISAACGPDLYGKLIWIDGLGVRWCEDRGGDVKAGHVDVLLESYETARAFGRQRRQVLVLRNIK